jgi:hypothetical protein
VTNILPPKRKPRIKIRNTVYVIKNEPDRVIRVRPIDKPNPRKIFKTEKIMPSRKYTISKLYEIFVVFISF